MDVTMILNINAGNHSNDDVWIDHHEDGDCVVIIDFQDGCVEISRATAIAAARAILKHFDAMPGPVGKEEW